MDDTLQRRLGHHLRRHRKGLGLSQEKFAELLGFHRTYVGGLETGKRNPSLKSVEGLARALDLDPLSLLAPIDGEVSRRTTRG